MTEESLRDKLESWRAEAWRARGRVPSFGVKIVLERDCLGLTQRQLSKLSGVPRSTISEIENGKTKAPKAATVEKIIDALDAALSERAEKKRRLEHIKRIENGWRNIYPPAPETSREPGVRAASEYLEKRAARRRLSLDPGDLAVLVFIFMSFSLAAIILMVSL